MHRLKNFLLPTFILAGLVGAFLFSRGTSVVPPVAAGTIKQDTGAPTGGNPAGDVTVVVFSDYNCPFCKTADAALEKLSRDDGHIRLVYKDWPILTDASTYGARMALAAGYQGKYAAVHNALMAIPGMQISQSRMQGAIKASGVDMARLDADMGRHARDIDAQLKRNNDQAEALGLQGTPAFVVGRYLVPQALDYNGFKKLVGKVRSEGRK